MKFSKALLASAALVATMSANATLTGSTILTTSASFLTLSSTGLSNGAVPVASLVGGTVYPGSVPGAVKPSQASANFLAAGPSSGAPATLTFTPVVDYVSFLWGSPDLYNLLTVTTTLGTTKFTVAPTAGATSLNFATTNGNQSFSQYVQFITTGGEHILSLMFDNAPKTDAFETANFSITPVPEPETYALMLAGLGAIGFLARRRKSV